MDFDGNTFVWGGAKNIRNKIDKPLAKVINKKAQIRNENGEITTYRGNLKNYNGLLSSML